MNKVITFFAMLLTAVVANASSSCPGKVYFTNGRTMECAEINIPGYVNDKVTVYNMVAGKKERTILDAAQIDRIDLWHEKNPKLIETLYCKQVDIESRRKTESVYEWMVLKAEGKNVSFYKRFLIYSMQKDGLAGIVNNQLYSTEPEAFYQKNGEKPTFMKKYIAFQMSNKQSIALMEKYFSDDAEMMDYVRQQKWIIKREGLRGIENLLRYVAEHYNPQPK